MPILSCLYKYSILNYISHPLTMCIIVSLIFWHNRYRLEPPCFHIFYFITLVARACSCAAHISDSISNNRCDECNHFFPLSMSNNFMLSCCLNNCPFIFMLSNTCLCSSLISLVVLPLFTTRAHDIIPCTCLPSADFTI